MKGFQKIIAAVIVSASILGATVVKAEEAGDVYEGGGYRVVKDQVADGGLTYEGCNAKRECVSLSQGKAWSSRGRRGVTWTNNQYRYILSWASKTPNKALLEVYKGKTRTLQRNLVQTSGN